jgi:hypothetical protein
MGGMRLRLRALHGTRMLAIDQSASPATPSERRELGLNIEPAADILQLDPPATGRHRGGRGLHQFARSAGRLPLIALLRPGAFMRIGLYSTLARQRAPPRVPYRRTRLWKNCR